VWAMDITFWHRSGVLLPNLRAGATRLGRSASMLTSASPGRGGGDGAAGRRTELFWIVKNVNDFFRLNQPGKRQAGRRYKRSALSLKFAKLRRQPNPCHRADEITFAQKQCSELRF